MRNDIAKTLRVFFINGIKPNYSKIAKQFNCDTRTVKRYFLNCQNLKRKPRVVVKVLDCKFRSKRRAFFTPKLSHFQLNSLTQNTNLFHLYLYSMEWSSFAINWLLFYVVIYELRLRILNETRLPNCNRNIGSSP